MNYATLSKQVRILWQSARYGWDLDATYRDYLRDKVNEYLIKTKPGNLDHLRDHLAFDYRLDATETQRFAYWWAHITEKGFNAGNPLGHLHKPKVGVK